MMAPWRGSSIPSLNVPTAIPPQKNIVRVSFNTKSNAATSSTTTTKPTAKTRIATKAAFKRQPQQEEDYTVRKQTRPSRVASHLKKTLGD